MHALADNQEYFQIAFAWAHHLPGPHYWLLLLHSLGIFSCGIAAFALSRRLGAIALLMPAFVWLSPFLININLDLFHTEAFATILILLMYAGARAGKLVLYLVSLSLALLCKEDVAITVATFSVLAWLKPDWFALPRRVFQWSALAAVAVFSINLLVVLPHYKLQTCLWLDPGFNAAGLDAAPVAPFFRNTFANLFHWDFYRERLGRVLVLLYLVKLMWPVLLVAPKVGPFWLLPLPGAAINVIADADYLVKWLLSLRSLHVCGGHHRGLVGARARPAQGRHRGAARRSELAAADVSSAVVSRQAGPVVRAALLAHSPR